VKKNGPPGIKARRYGGMILGYPNTEGGMRGAFPPYGEYGD